MNEKVIINVSDCEFNIRAGDKAEVLDKYHIGGGIWKYRLFNRTWFDPDDIDSHSFWFGKQEFRYKEVIDEMD